MHLQTQALIYTPKIHIVLFLAFLFYLTCFTSWFFTQQSVLGIDVHLNYFSPNFFIWVVGRFVLVSHLPSSRLSSLIPLGASKKI